MQSTTYVAIANYYDSVASSYDISSYIMRFDPTTERLLSFQNITTRGCTHLKPFMIGADQCLAAANMYNSTAKNAAQSEIFIFDSIQNQFISLQLLLTSGAQAIETFSINDILYLFVSNYQDSLGTKIISSKLYQWQSIMIQFSVFQPIATQGAKFARYFTIGSDGFLAVPNYYDGSSYYQTSKVYKWCNSQFVLS